MMSALHFNYEAKFDFDDVHNTGRKDSIVGIRIDESQFVKSGTGHWRSPESFVHVITAPNSDCATISFAHLAYIDQGDKVACEEYLAAMQLAGSWRDDSKT